MRRYVLGVLVAALAVPVAVAGGCTTPPDIGYSQAGRMTTLPGTVTDATTLVPDGSEGGPLMMAGLCAPGGVVCHKDSDCCGDNTCKSGSCTGPGATPGTGLCAPDQIVCTEDNDCCDHYCSVNHVCGDIPANTCVPDGVVCQITSLFPAPGGTCCNPCTTPVKQPCNTCDPNEGCIGPDFKPNKTPYCTPLGVMCEPGATPPCCAGLCYENELTVTVCSLPP